MTHQPPAETMCADCLLAHTECPEYPQQTTTCVVFDPHRNATPWALYLAQQSDKRRDGIRAWRALAALCLKVDGGCHA